MIEMVRDESREWPPGTPPGRFDISTSPLRGFPAVGGHILFVCPNGKRCAVFLGVAACEQSHPEPRDPAKPETVRIWAWDGNLERPTLDPSINCITEKDGKPTSGCGWHGFVRAGRMG